MAYDEFYAKLESLGHKLRRDEDGDIDSFACDADTHNGPACEICEEGWCVHCEWKKMDKLKPCSGPPPEVPSVFAELAALRAEVERLREVVDKSIKLVEPHIQYWSASRVDPGFRTPASDWDYKAGLYVSAARQALGENHV